MSSRRARTTPWNLIVVGVVGVILVGGLLVLRSRGQATMADPSIAAGSSSAAELEALLAAPAGSTGFEGEADPAKSKILSKTSLEEAIAVARPMMSNTVGRLDVGSAQLAMWASKSLSWQALEALPETSPALFKKDPDAERGRRFCMSGTVLEIRADKSLTNRLVEDKSLPLIEQPSAQNQGSTDTTYAHSDSPSASAEGAASAMPDPLLIQGIDFAIPDGGKVYIATLQSRAETNPDGNSARMKAGPHDSTFVEIIAVRSTGSLVDGSDARVCGVLTGVTVPPSGGSSSAVIDFSPVHRIVGMFDLPQNHFAPTGAVAAQHG